MRSPATSAREGSQSLLADQRARTYGTIASGTVLSPIAARAQSSLIGIDSGRPYRLGSPERARTRPPGKDVADPWLDRPPRIGTRGDSTMRRTLDRWFRRVRWSGPLATLATYAALATAASAIEPGEQAANFPYPDPEATVGTANVHDPSMLIRPTAPRYGLFGTGGGIPMWSSADRSVFAITGSAFTTSTPAWWATYTGGSRGVWAPDVSYRGDTYFMYYAASTFGSGRSAIGLATSDTGLADDWDDQGIVIESFPTSEYNAIDPNLTVTSAGQWYLTFGSYRGGIHSLALDPNTGKRPASLPDPQRIAEGGNEMHEAPYLYRRGAYYYLFTSRGKCCPNQTGPNPTYNIRVARSTSPTGGFRDRAGLSLFNGGGTLVLEGHGHLKATGHQGVFLETNDNKERLYYHYYDASNLQPHLGINVLNWSGDGWPYLMHNYGRQLPDTYKLFGDDYLESASGSYRLKVQLDCNLVERRVSDGAVVWSSQTSGLGSGCWLAMQNDGNLVLYNGAGSPVWSTRTNGTGDDNRLVLQNDGNIIVFNESNVPVWTRF